MQHRRSSFHAAVRPTKRLADPSRALPVVVVSFFVACGAAHAQVFVDGARSTEEATSSTTEARSTFTLGGGASTPHLEEFGIDSVDRCALDGRPSARVGGDVDAHLLDDLGSLQLTLGLDASRALPRGANTATPGGCVRSTSKDVDLVVGVGRVGLTYRFDPLLDRFGIPVVPYARVGGIVAGYSLTGASAAAADDDAHAYGVRPGVEAAAGVSVALDFLDRVDPFKKEGQRRARATSGLLHSYAFVEGSAWSIAVAERIGATTEVRLATPWPSAWRAGIAVELL